MLKASPRGYRNVRLVVFDLDGTLTESKAAIAPDMVRMLEALLLRKKVAVIGGGSYRQFREQFVDALHVPRPLLANLFLFPTTSTRFYRYKGGWKLVYSKDLPAREKKRIRKAIKESLKEIRYVPPAKTYGKVIEDRGAQITFSALGQDVVKVLGPVRGVALKERWHKTSDIRDALIRALTKRLPEYAHEGGFTSVDITMRGIDKAYGVRQIEKTLRIPIKDMVFIGDALFPGGNDAAAKKTGVRTIPTKGPKETKAIIAKILEAA